MTLSALDDLDRRILDQLQQDASITNHALAELVHASPPTCLRRVKRLQALGVIAKQVALLNPEKLGSALTAIVEVTLDAQSSEQLPLFEAAMQYEGAVKQC